MPLNGGPAPRRRVRAAGRPGGAGRDAQLRARLAVGGAGQRPRELHRRCAALARAAPCARAARVRSAARTASCLGWLSLGGARVLGPVPPPLCQSWAEAWNQVVTLSQTGGNPVTGPYEIQEPERFFLPDFYNYSFNPEVRALANCTRHRTLSSSRCTAAHDAEGLAGVGAALQARICTLCNGSAGTSATAALCVRSCTRMSEDGCLGSLSAGVPRCTGECNTAGPKRVPQRQRQL